MRSLTKCLLEMETLPKIKVSHETEEDIYTLRAVDVIVDKSVITMQFRDYENGDVDDIEPHETEDERIFNELDDDTQQGVYDAVIDFYAPMSLTTNRDDERLGKRKDNGQNEAYLVLSDEERAKGFVQPVRNSYIHRGKFVGPEAARILNYDDDMRIKHSYHAYIENKDPNSALAGIYVTEEQLALRKGDYVGGCGALTTMDRAIAETYARDPKFYGATFCISCKEHLPVQEFIWEGTDQTVGSIVPVKEKKFPDLKSEIDDLTMKEQMDQELDSIAQYADQYMENQEPRFTIDEIKNYLLGQDSMGDILYNLSEENIRKANEQTEEE